MFFSFFFHCQSQVEGGYSVNKALMNDKMQEKTVINRRSVIDLMQTHKLKPYEVETNKRFQAFAFTNID